jgi:parvulin-like peptidyl-prolyl isomerase
MTKILWIAIPVVFSVAIGLTLFGPKPELRPEIKLRQIVVVADATDPEDVERARSKIEDVYEELRGGADFIQLAKDRSEALNAGAGGDMGWMGEGRLPTILEEAAFATESGHISEIIEESRGEETLIFRILYVEERRNF